MMVHANSMGLFCAYIQILEYTTYVLSVTSWLIDNKIMLHYQLDESIAVIFISNLCFITGKVS